MAAEEQRRLEEEEERQKKELQFEKAKGIVAGVTLCLLPQADGSAIWAKHRSPGGKWESEALTPMQRVVVQETWEGDEETPVKVEGSEMMMAVENGNGCHFQVPGVFLVMPECFCPVLEVEMVGTLRVAGCSLTSCEIDECNLRPLERENCSIYDWSSEWEDFDAVVPVAHWSNQAELDRDEMPMMMGYMPQGTQVLVKALVDDRALIEQVDIGEWPERADPDEDFWPKQFEFDAEREPSNWDRNYDENVEVLYEPNAEELLEDIDTNGCEVWMARVSRSGEPEWEIQRRRRVWVDVAFVCTPSLI